MADVTGVFKRVLSSSVTQGLDVQYLQRICSDGDINPCLVRQ